MPFCAAATLATAVVLAPCSVRDGERLNADSGAVGGTHSTGSSRAVLMYCGRGRRPPRLLLLLRPEHMRGTPST